MKNSFAGWVTLLTSLVVTGCGGSMVTTQFPPPTIATGSLPDGTIGASYSATIQATGGTAPFSWSVSGSLPGGLALQPSAGNSVVISGTPAAAQKGVKFTIQIKGADGQGATQPFTMDVRSLVAQTETGNVQGVVVGDLLEYRGIPYAAPPVGNLRWQPPQPAAAWTGTRDASAFGNVCPEIDSVSQQIVGSEDCLFLNVYTSTQVPHGQPQPVMVAIHGGSNTGGSTQRPNYLSPPIATQGVVLVTLEYRLGLMGFLVHPLLDAEGGGSSGNYGLMDQIAALAWVKRNIANFGGDPSRVMVFGQSAGSYDVQVLLTSPPARGLFSAAGMESGSLIHAEAMKLADLEAMEAPFVNAVGCSKAADVLACLRGVSTMDIVNNQDAIFNLSNGFVAPTIVIEPRVIPVDPFDALAQHGTPVPLLLGSTREEAAGSGPDDPTVSPPMTEAQYEADVQAEFGIFGNTAPATVLSFYPSAQYDSPVYAMIAVDSDFDEIAVDRNVARAAASANGPPVWRYLYTHQYENDPTLRLERAFHVSELPFVLGTLQSVFGTPYTPSADEISFSSTMMGYWTRFAATGNPNGGGAAVWPKYEATTDSMLQLDVTPVQINGYHNPQCDYLVKLYESKLGQ